MFLGKDVLAKAKTGTGKTVAFLVSYMIMLCKWAFTFNYSQLKRRKLYIIVIQIPVSDTGWLMNDLVPLRSKPNVHSY